MTSQEIEQRAYELINGGYNCAESVLLAVSGACGDVPPGSPRIATCFGGGVGKTREEMCGALAGGLMALGLIRGRDKQGSDWNDVAELAARLREDFIGLFGASACKDVLAALGDQENFAKCKQLTGRTGGLTFELLQTHSGTGGKTTCGCGETCETGQ